MSPTMSHEDAEALARRIKADKRQAEIARIADQLSALVVIERPSFYVALEALKHTAMNLTATMLLTPGLENDAIFRRLELAVNEAQDLYRTVAALARDITQRGPDVALAELRTNITILDTYLPETPPHGHKH